MRWALLLLAGCVTTPAPAPTPPPAPPPPPVVPKENAVRMRAAAFDVTTCAKATPPTPLNADTFAAFIELERPRLESCLAPSDSRTVGDGGIVVEVTLGPGPTTKVSGPVTDSAVRCVQARVAELGWEKLQPPNVTHTELAAPFGAPEPDAPMVPEVAALRAAVTQSCSCFDWLGVNAPPQLVLRQAPGRAVDVVTASDPLAERLERCLEAALASVPPPTLELTIDLPLINGDALHESPDAQPDVAAAQAAAIERRLRAQLTLVRAQRAAAVRSLNTLAKPLKQKPTPALLQARRAHCRTLVELDELLASVRERAKQPAVPADESLSVCDVYRAVE